MNLKGLLIVIIKVLGIYVGLQAVMLISEFVESVTYFAKEETISFGIFFIIGMLLTLAAYFIIARFLIFKTDSIVKKIVQDDRLEADFTTFKVHRSVVLTIAVIVVGSLTLINEIPLFIRHIYNYNFNGKFVADVRFDYLLFSGIKILIGLYLVYYNKLVVAWIEKKRIE